MLAGVTRVPLPPLCRGAELNTARQSSHKSPARDDGAGGPPIVISTEAKRSGEISPSDGTGGITVGDLSTQSIIGAVPVCLPYRHVPPLEMTMLASTSGHTFGVRVQRVHKVQRVQRGRLTALRAEGCGRLSAAGYVRFAQGATALRAEGDGGALRAQIIKKAPHSRHFDRSGAEWRNLTPQMTEKPARALRHFDESRSAANRKASYCAG